MLYSDAPHDTRPSALTLTPDTHVTAPDTVTPPAHSHVFYTRKISYNENIYQQRGFADVTFSLYDVIIFILMRSSGRFCQQARKYIQQETGMIPDFMNHIDVEASKVTTSLLRDIIKKWRQSGLDTLPLDPKQLKSLDKTISEVSEDLEAGRQPVFSNVLEDSGETTVFLVERQGIPLIDK